MNVKTPTVSVCMITYNHEAYIKEAIESVLTQDVDCGLELIIANDCSTDATHSVILNLIQTHPKGHSIKYVNHKKNVGMIPNFIGALKRCTGEYIAFCEGDDYWTDSLKLKKQVDFLRNHLDYGICFHLIKIYNEDTKTFNSESISNTVNDTSTILDLAEGNFMHTPSVVIRNDFKIPKWFEKVAMGDWSLYMVQIKDRKIKKIEETMAVYREHSASVWSSKTQRYRLIQTIENLELVKKNLRPLSKGARGFINQSIKRHVKDVNFTFFESLQRMISKIGHH